MERGKIRQYAFTVVIPTVVGVMISPISLTVGACVIVAALVVGLAELLWDLTPNINRRAKLIPILVMAVSAIAFGGGAVFFVSAWLKSNADSPATAPAAQVPIAGSAAPELPTLLSLFMTELTPPVGMRWEATTDFEVESHGAKGTVRVLYAVLDDFNAHSKYMAFYVPAVYVKGSVRGEQSTEILKAIAEKHRSFLDDIQKERWAELGGRGRADTESTAALPFSGRIYLYYADDLSLAQLAEVSQAFKSHGADPQFRGMEHALAVWDGIQLGRIKAPPKYEMRDGLPVDASKPGLANPPASPKSRRRRKGTGGRKMR